MTVLVYLIFVIIYKNLFCELLFSLLLFMLLSTSVLVCRRMPIIYYCQGKQFCYFRFSFLLKRGLLKETNLERGQLLKERICSPRSKFFLIRVGPHFGSVSLPGKQTHSYKSYFSLNCEIKNGMCPHST